MSAPSRVAAVPGIIGLSLIALLAGCAVGPDYRRPTVELPAAYPDAAPPPGENAESKVMATQWWTLYSDATLNELVAATLQNNSDLRKALAQIDEAEAALTEIGSSLFPQIDLGASASRSRSSTLSAQPLQPGTPTISNTNRLALSTSFELDFWGKLRRASQAARAQLTSTRYARDVTALTLTGATAQSYFALRSLDAQIAISEPTLASRQEALAVMKHRATGGVASDLEVNQAEVARADAALQLLELQRQRALAEHQLGLLTGKLNLRIPAQDPPKLAEPIVPPLGLPSTLVERRPDVQQAEQVLIAANARIGVAKAAQLPTFSLTGNFGGQSKDLGDVLQDAARIWSLGLGATLPIFDSGKYAARTRQAEARRRQAEEDYRKTVENAFTEVADALSNMQQSGSGAADLRLKVDAARNALRLSQLRYEAGYSAYLEVLDAQRTANAAEQALLQNRQAQLIYSVDLMKSLGGGWTPRDTAPTVQR